MNHTQQANQWLSRFEVAVTSNANRVFANGRQQVEITLSIEPRKGQEITAEQLATLQLVVLDDDGIPRDLQGDLQVSDQRDPRFAYHAASGAVPSALLQSTPRTLRRRFYVSSTLAGGTLSTLYAGIWKDPETHFETTRAPFQSSVIIESIAAPEPHISMFNLELEKTRETYHVEGAHDDEFEYQIGHFGCSDPRNSIVESRPHATPSGEAFYWRHNWEHVLISFTGTNDYSQHCYVAAYGVNETVEFDTAQAQRRLRNRPNHMSLCLYHRRFYRHHYSDRAEHASRWTVLDKHGNAYGIEFVATESGRCATFRLTQAQA
ncbi:MULTISPECIES: hypothetical protein [unclassified Pseudomonas]|uniref:hypothetical protein n=1 Tax=unclassified Pseudomonas TaxID=196821 RepID=UPI00209828CE|nr:MULTISPECIES: hypothetical protein [unclassified Pseudomonas]MCO7522351.1 hypothetical protein [Pseudomonas sp. 1]MCO7542811.1 hypothetical protein [Pseudomonas sp. VA159-2]